MRFIWFNLMPWPYLPEDFREKYRSVWVDIPCAYRLCHPNVVPMETAEPSD